MPTSAPFGAALLSTALWFVLRTLQGARRLGRPGGLGTHRTTRRR